MLEIRINGEVGQKNISGLLHCRKHDFLQACGIDTSFFSPLQGEVLSSRSHFWTSVSQKNRHFVLTHADLVSFNLPMNYKKTRQLLQKEFQIKSKLINDVLIKYNKKIYKVSGIQTGKPDQKNKLRIGEFCLFGDQLAKSLLIPQAGQIIHANQSKITLRRGQPIYVSPKGILHAYNGDFIKKNTSVVTLPYQTLKTGDIVQGIPKIEQYFEARTTKRGRLFRDNLPNLLKGLFKRYKAKLPWDKAVRQSFYKIQQILVDGVQRVYRSQGVSIADKHIEVIVKQMTAKVKITHGGQTGFFPGELVDLEFVEHVNQFLMKKIRYEPVILGITKASLEVESFLSSASFQQTTRMLSRAAIHKRKDFLKGLKENVILGNLIPAGTGYLVTIDDIQKKKHSPSSEALIQKGRS